MVILRVHIFIEEIFRGYLSFVRRGLLFALAYISLMILMLVVPFFKQGDSLESRTAEITDDYFVFNN